MFPTRIFFGSGDFDSSCILGGFNQSRPGRFMEELSYAIVTPYSMRKSRTGGIVARLISRTGLDVAAGRMFAPSAELVSRYAETIVTET